MFIEDVVCQIWSEEAKVYHELYEQAMKMDTMELFNQLKDCKMGFYQYPQSNMNLLSTCGCSHHNQDGKLCGCSMCDYHSTWTKGLAAFKALRDKDVNLYAKVVRLSFENARGLITEQTYNEVISGYDFLCKEEFPDEVYEELFGKNGPIKVRPFRYSFETRASSVTRERLQQIREYFGKGRAVVEIGVEVADLWVKNHWINKYVSNDQIIEAIKLSHEFGFKLCADVLLGIPGLTEEQSIYLFVDTIKFLEKNGVDKFTIMPLNRKTLTLQGYIYDHLRENQILMDVGLVNGEHTGIPWLFTAVEGLCEVIEYNPKLASRIGIGQYSSSQNSVSNEISYNYDRECMCNTKIIQTFEEFNGKRDGQLLLNLREELKEDKCYAKYLEMREKQKKAGSVKNTIQLLGEAIAKEMWPDQWEKQFELLTNELSTFEE